MALAFVLIGGMFMYDNQDFFGTVEDNIEKGMSWQYVGKQAPQGQPALTVTDGQGNEVIYFRMEK